MATLFILTFSITGLGALTSSPQEPSAQEELERLRLAVSRSDSVSARFELARGLARAGDNQASLHELDLAIEKAPNATRLLSARARVLLALRAPAPAVLTLEALVRMRPHDADAAYLLGVAKLQIAETSSGIASLRRALELRPGDGRSLLALGMALRDGKELAEAQRVLQLASQRMPGDLPTLVALAEVQEGLGEYGPAEASAERGLQSNPDSALALYIIGKIRMSEGRYEEARDALLRAVEGDPALARAHYQLSLAYTRLREHDRSNHHLELYRSALAAEEEHLISLRTYRPTLSAGEDER